MPLQRNNLRRHKRESGQSVIEATLMTPWILILFLAIVDIGFFGYAMVATENAARVAGLFAAETYQAGTDAAPKLPTAADQSAACANARNELRMMPNYDPNWACNAAPLQVAMNRIPSASSADGEPAVEVLVSYQSIQLFPIPGMIGRLNITRRVEVKPEN